MKKFILLLVLTFYLVSCNEGKRFITGETVWQKEINANFKDATKSPLKEKDRKNFNGLDFFMFDSIYVVTAKLNLTPDSKWFDMKTNTSRVSKERVYGILSFKIKDKSFQLNVYQGLDKMNEEGFEDYLFLPFIDNTNGDESYGGGRYIDLRIPEDDTVIVDFNKAYNPYCAYNEKYSCPIVPRANYVPIEVKAGVKAFGKHL